MAEIYTLERPAGRLTHEEACEVAAWQDMLVRATKDQTIRLAQREARRIAEAQAHSVMLDAAAGDAAFQRKLQDIRLGAHAKSARRDGYLAGMCTGLRHRDFAAAGAGALIAVGALLIVHGLARLGWL